LSATVIGSGIMAERLAGGNVAVALIANTGATVAVLAALIALFGPVSGAHFKPAMSLVQALRGVISWPTAGYYVLVQIAGCCAGAMLAHTMFDLPLIQLSRHARTGFLQWLGEFVATLGLLMIVLGVRRPEDAPSIVAPHGRATTRAPHIRVDPIGRKMLSSPFFAERGHSRPRGADRCF
jgi:glycerol uptake facilitator-like aquaporin